MYLSLILCHLLKTLSHCTALFLCREASLCEQDVSILHLLPDLIFSLLTISGTLVGLTGEAFPQWAPPAAGG